MILTVIQSHLSRYPAMQIPDLYKLLHQASLGSEHAIADPKTAQNWLACELKEMGEGPVEPLIDPISADGEIVRVHLRPYVASGHAADLLLDVFIRTANEYHGEMRLLEQYWQAAVDAAFFPAAAMDEFIQPLKERNFPAVRHSPVYKLHYRPCYRVIALQFCPDR